MIDYHPNIRNLFIATGDSGHGFKVYPVIGDKIVDAIDGKLEMDLKALWGWKDGLHFDGAKDGSRGGQRGMVLEDEWNIGGYTKSHV